MNHVGVPVANCAWMREAPDAGLVIATRAIEEGIAPNSVRLAD